MSDPLQSSRSKRSAAIAAMKLPKLTKEERERFRPLWFAWLEGQEQQPEDDGYLPRDLYQASRWFIYSSAQEVVGRPVSEGAAKFMLAQWGYWHTPNQKEKRDAWREKAEAKDDA